LASVRFIVDCTPLKALVSTLYEMKLGEEGLMEVALSYVADFGLVIIFLGVVVAFASKGKKKGLLQTLRLILVKIFGIVAGLAAAYLPFSPYAAEGGLPVLVSIVETCTGFVAGFGLPEMAVIIAGQIVASIVLVIFSVVLTFALKVVFHLLISATKEVTLLRKIDGALGCMAYLIIGALVCLLAWAVVYAGQSFNLFTVSSLFTEKATIPRCLFTLMEMYIEPLLNTAMGFLGK
jgi:hypothetical protein